jgi:DNA-binding phage protein
MSKYPEYNRKEFVKVWLEAYAEGKNSAWVAEKTGISRNRVYGRVNYLRTQVGVKLPSLQKYSSYVSAIELNQIIEDALQEKGNA